MMEAGCLEWALLIAIILRDSISVVRVVNTVCLTDTPIEMVGRMREGLSYIELWADTERLVRLCPRCHSLGVGTRGGENHNKLETFNRV